MSRKFYRNVVQIVVLTEDEPLGGGVPTLSSIEYEINYGDCVGGELSIDSKQISSKQVADALYDLGSEPGFFQLDDDGNSVDEEYKDGEVVGIDPNGDVIQWDAATQQKYVSGENLEEYGIDNLSQVEKQRLGII